MGQQRETGARRRRTTRRTPQPPKRRLESSLLIGGAGGILVLLLVVVWATSGSSSPTPPGEARPTKKEARRKLRRASAPSPGPRDARYRDLAGQLATLSEELDLAPPPVGLSTLEALVARIRPLGHEDLLARADALRARLNRAAAAYVTEEVDAALARIEKLLDAEQLLDARQVHDDLKRQVGALLAGAPKTRVAAVSARIARLEKQRATALRGRIEQLLTRGSWTEARAQIRRLAAYGEVGKQLATRYDKSLAARRRAFLEAQLTRRREAGQARYERARARLARRKTAAAKLLERRGQVARTRTAKQPIRVALRGGQVYQACRISGLTPLGVVVDARHGGRAVSGKLLEWRRMAPRSRLLATRVSLTDDDARGQVALAKYCIVHKLYDAAEQALRRAVRIEPALRGKLPDVGRFRRGATFASGTVTRPAADRVQVAYGFDDSHEAQDFAAEEEDGEQTLVYQLETRDGQLRFPSGVVVMAPPGSGQMGIRPPMKAVFAPGSAPPGGYLLIQLVYEEADGGAGLYLLLNDKQDRYVIGQDMEGLQRVIDGLEAGNLRFQHCQPGSKITIDVARDTVSLRLGTRQLVSERARAREAMWLFAGISRNPDATFGMEGVTISGTISAAAYRRVVAEKRSMLLRSLERDLQRQAAPDRTRLPKLHAAYAQRLAPKRRAHYQRLLESLERYLTQMDDTRRLRVAQALERCDVDGERPFAPLFFWRAWFKLNDEELPAALRDFQRAVQVDPNFSEALAHLAWTLLRVNRHAEAHRAAERAVAVQPDNALARAAQALLAFYRRTDPAQGQRAVDLMETAVLLAPGRDELRQELRQLRHVLAGPPWPNGTPTPITSAHYTIHTDLPPAEAKVIVDELERMYAVYARFLPPGTQRIRRGEVYVFSTLATYSIYSELTSSDPAHNTLGYYHPGFKSLYLFKSAEDTGASKITETLATLRHEAFHQYVDNLIPRFASWANEGLGEHFGTTRFTGGEPAWGIDEGRLKQLLQYLESNDPMPFERLMKLSHPEFMEYEAAYPQAWSMMYLFCVHEPDRYRDVLMRYLALLRAGKSRLAAYDETFGKLPMSKVQEAWRRMLRQLAGRLSKE